MLVLTYRDNEDVFWSPCEGSTGVGQNAIKSRRKINLWNIIRSHFQLDSSAKNRNIWGPQKGIIRPPPSLE